MLLQLQLVYIYGIVYVYFSDRFCRSCHRRQPEPLAHHHPAPATESLERQKDHEDREHQSGSSWQRFLGVGYGGDTGFIVSIDPKKAGQKIRDIEIMILQLELQSTWRFGVQKQKTDGSPKHNIKI